MKRQKNGEAQTGWRTWPAKERREFFTWLLYTSPIYSGSANAGNTDRDTASPSGSFSASLDLYEQAHREWWNTFLEVELPHTYEGLTNAILDSGVKPGSPLWHCAKILEIIRVIRIALQRNDIEQSAQLAVALGLYMSRLATITTSFELIRLGAKIAPHFESGRAIANAERKAAAAQEHRSWITAARQVWKRHPQHSVTACARIVINNLSLSARPKTVADVIRSHKKAGGAR